MKKADLKLNIQKTKIMACGPITSWQTKGEKVEAMTDILFLGSKITTNKASGGDGIPVEVFQILKDDAVQVLY